MPGDAAQLIEQLRAEGIRDERVLAAVAATPREVFVEAGYERAAFDDRALPIACGQTISQPYVVAYMTEALEIAATMRILEVGTGSGYQTAILSRLAAQVFTIERHKPLLEQAKMRFSALGLTNITLRHGDGYEGWPDEAPFDRILVTAAFHEVPQGLSEQLADGGILIAPVGYETLSQRLVKMIRSHDRVPPDFTTEPLLPVVFVPMVPGLPRERDGDF